MAKTILIVDDDPTQRRLMRAVCEKAGYPVLQADSGENALSLLQSQQGADVSLVMLDLRMPGLGGMETLKRTKSFREELPVIVLTAQGGIDTVVEAMQNGAADFFVKPASPERVIVSINNALNMSTLKGEVSRLKRKKEGALGFKDLIGESAALRHVMRLGERAAASNIPILISGESGVGKEMIARAIQGSSERSGRPFITVNCGAIPENLVESILFGHEKGSFTGATGKHTGKFQEADGGTIFLDEIGDMPADMQVKLLRVLEERKIERVGSNKTMGIDVRVVSATHKNLEQAIAEGRFREDLFYRLNIFPLQLPALADRREDIPMLVAHFLKLSGTKVRFDASALRALCQHNWPGNIRELRNVVERAVVLFGEDDISVDDIEILLGATLERREPLNEESAIWDATTVSEEEADTRLPATTVVSLHPNGDSLDMDPRALIGAGKCDMRALVAKLEQSLIHAALEQSGDIVADAARVLGLQRTSLIEKMRKYQIGRGERVAA